MKASVTNWIQSSRIELSDKQYSLLKKGNDPQKVLEAEQWSQIRKKIPRTPAMELVFRAVDPETDMTSYELIWYQGMNEVPRRKYRYIK